MEEKNKDIDLNFTPQVKLGEVLFSFNEQEVLQSLGASAERSLDIFNDREYVIHLDYWSYNFFVSVYYENNKFDYLSIHTQDIILEDFRFSDHKKKDILSFIKQYHEKYKILFLEKEEYDKDTDEICYNYESIGLTIWFDRTDISDISVQKTKG